ncbi:MAG: YceD family protein [Mangrovibacterium sp.]
MAGINSYNIEFKGLALGTHVFDFRIDNYFFDLFDGGIADDGNLQVQLTLEKQSALMVLWFHAEGTVKIQCDRCLDLYDQAIRCENKVFIKYGEDNYEDGDDVIWVNTNDHQVNVAQMIYDFIILAIPFRQVHPKDKDGKSLCNKEMLKKLKALTASPEKTEPTSDSRWDDLKKLLENE